LCNDAKAAAAVAAGTGTVAEVKSLSMKALKSFPPNASHSCQSPLPSERLGHQPCGPGALVGGAGCGGGRS
jgi:hypothetical protein